MASTYLSASSPLPQPSPVPLKSPVDGMTPAQIHDAPELVRTASTTSTKVDPALARQATLRKRTSLRKRGSLSRRSSRRSLAGGISPYGDGGDEDFNNVFNVPIPTTGSPTDILGERFQAWRRLLKDIIAYLGEVKASYEHRAKSLIKVSNVINNTHTPNVFPATGGLGDAIDILRNYHKIAIAEANKANNIEDDVITQLNGLRSDLNQKIKEIKSLSGDFKNSVEKEKDGTRKAVAAYEAALAASESDPSNASGRNDPFLVRLAVERQVERQIEEENYLHRAYLNLEGSGRELEAIVVGEIQKAYNALAGILRREADNDTNTIDNLRAGPITMPRDHEWSAFVEKSPQFVNPSVPVRKLENIHYPNKSNPAAAEIRAGNLERKSKYLKSYTPGWYVLSPTHLHEFKSPDHVEAQTPVMSLYLLDQRLGSRSAADASSHKFSLKGKQAGGMHRGHAWVFRTESYETMMAWYDDIQSLTEKTGEDKALFIRKHARTISAGSYTASMSSDGLVDDEADDVPYSGQTQGPDVVVDSPPKRPEPGGRFPSDLSLAERRLQRPVSSGSEVNHVELAKAENAQAAVAQPARHGTEAKDYFGSAGLAPPVAAQAVPDRSASTTPRPIHQVQENNISHATSVKAQSPSGEHHAAMMAGALAAPVATPSQSGTTKEAAAVVPVVAVDEHQSASPDPSTMKGTSSSAHSTAATNLESTLSRSEAVSSDTLASSIAGPLDGIAASPTGKMFPTLRHNTELSVSQLHVPGEFPPTPAIS